LTLPHFSFSFAGWCREYDVAGASAEVAKTATAASSRPPSFAAERPKSWVEAALQRRLSHWAELMDLNIVCVTWNVAGSMPRKPEHFTSLAQLVQLHDASLLAIAFQEAVDLNASALGIDTVTPDTQSAIDLFLQVHVLAAATSASAA
jgi:hypothetical protein